VLDTLEAPVAPAPAPAKTKAVSVEAPVTAKPKAVSVTAPAEAPVEAPVTAKPKAVSVTAPAEAPVEAPVTAKPKAKGKAKASATAPTPALKPKAAPRPPEPERVRTPEETLILSYFTDMRDIPTGLYRQKLIEFIDMYRETSSQEAFYCDKPMDVWNDPKHPLHARWQTYVSNLDMEKATALLAAVNRCQQPAFIQMLSSWVGRQIIAIGSSERLIEELRRLQ
jgi:hypothetical protein